MISVCMPYYERQSLLDRSLEAYRRLYGDLIEICICDDGSSEPVNAPGCRVKYLPEKKHGLCETTPVNESIALASNDFIFLTGPEIFHTEPILEQMLEAVIEIGPKAYVTAACWCTTNQQWISHSSITHLADPSKGRGPRPEGSQFHFCAMFHRSLWDEIGGLDEAYREGQAWVDNDLLFSLEAVGAEFRQLDHLVTEHTRTGVLHLNGGWERNRQLFNQKWGARLEEMANGTD